MPRMVEEPGARARHPFLARLSEGILLADGAMGTFLYDKGIPFDRSFDALNLVEPALIQSVHREYIRAGAEVIETNTFGANRFRLAAQGEPRRRADRAERARRGGGAGFRGGGDRPAGKAGGAARDDPARRGPRRLP